jgi:hypothetical protein
MGEFVEETLDDENVMRLADASPPVECYRAVLTYPGLIAWPEWRRKHAAPATRSLV